MPVTIRAAGIGGNQTVINRVVVHCTWGSGGFPGESMAPMARRVAQYFATGTRSASAHYTVDASDPIQHSVPDARVAYHAPPNTGSIGVEICGLGHYTAAQWNDPRVRPAWERAARLVADICDRHGVPKRWVTPSQLRAGARGICTHLDVTQAWRQTDHDDPGPGFPKDAFMAAVLGAAGLPDPAPVVPAGPRVLGRGDAGPDVAELQRLLRLAGYAISVDGDFGPVTHNAVVAFQRARGLTVDGLAGEQTMAALRAPQATPAPSPNVTPTAPVPIPPSRPTLAVDGVFGPQTIRALQEWLGMGVVDGVIGPDTRRALQARLNHLAGLVAIDSQIGPQTIRVLQWVVGATVDGDWGPATTRALQAFLNRQGV